MTNFGHERGGASGHSEDIPEMFGVGLSRRRMIQGSLLAAFGTLVLPRIVGCAEEGPESILRFDMEGAAARPYAVGALQSTYLTMRDGVKIALDVVLPEGDGADTKLDTILVMTRYWRGEKGQTSNKYANLFAPHGYAVVVGDVRGTGASFGQWPHHRARAETLDYGEVIDWIAKQPWSKGSVVGYGLSYTANTADWMAERNNPVLKGIVPRFADYDPYEDLYFPGGIQNAYMGRNWGTSVKAMDRNLILDDNLQPTTTPGVRPVGAGGEADLQAALRDHEHAPSVWDGLQQVTFKDDRPASWNGDSFRDFSIQEVSDRVDRAGTPIQNWAGWFDAGTAQGAVRRFVRQSNPMNVIIGPWEHGGFYPYDPLRAPSEAIPPTTPSQEANDIRFADSCFNGSASRENGKVLHYYTLGAGTWKTTQTWPPPATRRRWYLASGFRLTPSPDQAGFDSLTVDRAAGDVTANRWATNNGNGKVDYGDRRPFDAARLAYTSEPLTGDLEITGHPIVELNVTSTREDGAFFVYLEAVSPNGVSRYLTEGQLRALHRKVWTESPFSALGPQHSFLKGDAEPLIPGQAAMVTFTMHPISALLRAGDRLRVCLAGSDVTTFANVPADGAPPIVQFQRGPTGCNIDLPITESE
ncbi:CocE/NonD family hydrolase [Nocardia rhizosphaerihabitans]|uniref:CocE/NonD family hydrolase n=1 Tax=Nocardia rhizosphaerihabitans TaxID=1691570 RepID=UPI003670E110